MNALEFPVVLRRLAIAALLFAFLAVAANAQEGVKFGALAIDRNNGFYFGFATDYDTPGGAEARALAECRNRGGNGTVVLSWSGSGYAVYRTIPGNAGTAYGWAVAPTFAEADAIATREALARSRGIAPTSFAWGRNSSGPTKIQVTQNRIKEPAPEPAPDRAKDNAHFKAAPVAGPNDSSSGNSGPPEAPPPRQVGDAAEAHVRQDEVKNANTTIALAAPKDETVTDVDGNVYRTVKIGTQTWMAENLRTTKFRDGSPIPQVTDNDAWKSRTAAAFCWQNNDASTGRHLGAVYNWYAAADPHGLAPAGWHVPTRNEWQELLDELGGAEFAAQKVKSAMAADWPAGGGGTDASNFKAVQVDGRDSNGEFSDYQSFATWWTRTNLGLDRWEVPAACAYGVNKKDVIAQSELAKVFGVSVRCVKD
jgi:uncharacterized protein (TIGR02145 family)